MAYEGGIEVFRTDAAKLVLAWLRILERDAETRVGTLVLEEAGYTIDEAKAIIEREAYPEAMVAFRKDLRELETFGGVARRVRTVRPFRPHRRRRSRHYPVGSRDDDVHPWRADPIHRGGDC